MRRDVSVPPEFVPTLEELGEKIVEAIRTGLQWESGASMVVQTMILVLIRIGYDSDPQIIGKLHTAVDTAFEQFKAEQN